MAQSTSARSARLWLEIHTPNATTRHTVVPIASPHDDLATYRLRNSAETLTASIMRDHTPVCSCDSYDPINYCHHVHALGAVGLFPTDAIYQAESAARQARQDAERDALCADQLKIELETELARVRELEQQLQSAIGAAKPSRPARRRRQKTVA